MISRDSEKVHKRQRTFMFLGLLHIVLTLAANEGQKF